MHSTDLTAHYLPEPTGPALDPYRLSGDTAVCAVIRELVQRHALITLYARRDHMFFVATQVLEFDDGTIDFDLNTDPQRRDAILAGDDCIVVAFLDQVKIQFDVRIIDARPAGEKWRLRCDAPDAIYRLQRREAYRIRFDGTREARCVLKAADNSETALELLDLSVTGVSLHWPESLHKPPDGTIWEHARIEIGQRVPLPCTLVVRYLNDEATHSHSNNRIGCSFVLLPPEIERAIQILVTDIQREQRTER